MSDAGRLPIAHVNLFNPGLMPAAKSFSARSVAVWGVIVAVVMIGLAWWAIVEKRNIAQQVADQKARRDAEGRSEEPVTTPQQIAALLALGRNLIQTYGIPPAAIFGHRDWPRKDKIHTACPGNFAYDLLPALRSKLAELTGQPLPEEKPRLLTTPRLGPDSWDNSQQPNPD